ncbi:MAG: hypothetical protein GY786_04725, partial [Proteobacteria bacterium]|nr:hypothetical protein [Pseudomonadota bacterium]
VGQPEFSKITASAVGADQKKMKLPFPEALFSKVAFPDKSDHLELTNSSSKDLFYSMTQAGFERQGEEKATNEVIEVARVMLDGDQQPLTKVKLGEEVDVILRTRTIDGSYRGNIAIIDLLPGGFEVVRDSIDRNSVNYIDVREDRIVLYTTADKKLKEFKYRIKATNRGEYVVPPIYGESMYDRKIHSITANGQITVE